MDKYDLSQFSKQSTEIKEESPINQKKNKLKQINQNKSKHTQEKQSDLKRFYEDKLTTIDMPQSNAGLDYPHGFENFERFEQFIQKFFKEFDRNGIRIIKIFFCGSSVSGYSTKAKTRTDFPDVPENKFWRFNSYYSDFDILVLPDYYSDGNLRHQFAQMWKIKENLINQEAFAKIDSGSKGYWFDKVKDSYDAINTSMSQQNFFVNKEAVHFAFYKRESQVDEYYKNAKLLEVKYDLKKESIETRIVETKICSDTKTSHKYKK